MPRVLFKETFNWHPNPNVTICHKAGREYLVTQRCADEAVAAGKGVVVQRQNVRSRPAGADRP